MNRRRIAVIGDRFMKPEAFVALLAPLVGGEADLDSLELGWPDEPMRHGYVDEVCVEGTAGSRGPRQGLGGVRGNPLGQ